MKGDISMSKWSCVCGYGMNDHEYPDDKYYRVYSDKEWSDIQSDDENKILMYDFPLPTYDAYVCPSCGRVMIFGDDGVCTFYKKEILSDKNDENYEKMGRISMSKTPNFKSTEAGYINKNDQQNNGRSTEKGTDHGQWFYHMECLKCGHRYLANGTDVWQRKCPKCQGGRP